MNGANPDSAAGGSAALRQVQARRFASQLLTGPPAGSVTEVTGRLLSVQGQDPRGARLAVRSRSAGLTAADVDRALTDGDVLITWLNRGTLHLVRSEDYWWLHRLLARPQFEVGCLRILARRGVSRAQAERGVDVIARRLAADGPLTGAAVATALTAAGLPADGGAALQMLFLASVRGLAVRGPMAGRQHAYVHVRDWLGAPPAAPEPEVMLGWLTRRYLAGHGPASDRDLAKWAGLALGPVRRGLTEISGELADRPDGLAELASQAADAEPAADPPTRLLGSFDPLLLGWDSREPVLGGHAEVVTVNGLFRPFALVDGVAAGTWSWRDGRVELEPFRPLSASATARLDAEASDVARFLTAGADSAILTGEAGPIDEEAGTG